MQVKQVLFQTLFPIRCILCDLTAHNDQLICADCRLTLPTCEARCHRCALCISNSSLLCGSCLQNPPAFDHTIALFNYDPPIQELITHYKFYGQLSIAHFFANEWIHVFKNNPGALPEAIIPVPLHHKRLKERGFNQALELAKPIGKYFNIAIDTQSLIRLKNTEAQSHLSAKKRKTNLKNCFAISYPIAKKHIGIFDDVMTTGSTVHEISTLLKKAGVEKVSVFCCARCI